MRNKSNQDMQDKWWKDLRRLCGAECEDKWFDKLSEWKLGVGGGGIFIPMLTLVIGFDAKSSTALSKC